MPKLNQYGCSNIQVGFDPRNGNIIDPFLKDQTYFTVHKIDAHGNYIRHPVNHQYEIENILIKLEDNIPFQAEMLLIFPKNMRKTTRVHLIDINTKRSYYTSTKRFKEMWPTITIVKGHVTGKWAFVRDGQRINLIIL